VRQTDRAIVRIHRRVPLSRPTPAEAQLAALRKERMVCPRELGEALFGKALRMLTSSLEPDP